MKTFYWVKVTHNDIKLDVCKLRNGESIYRTRASSLPTQMRCSTRY